MKAVCQDGCAVKHASKELRSAPLPPAPAGSLILNSFSWILRPKIIALRFPWPSTGPPSPDSPKMLRRLPRRLPGKLGVLGELLGELLQRLPGGLPLLWGAEKQHSSRQSPHQLPQHSSQHPQFPRQFPRQSPQQFWGIRAWGPCWWSGNRNNCLHSGGGP